MNNFYSININISGLALLKSVSNLSKLDLTKPQFTHLKDGSDQDVMRNK